MGSVSQTLSSWKDFMPGVVCGGKLEPSTMESRMEDCTEYHLKELQASSAFKAWERGEDLHARTGFMDQFLVHASDQWDTLCDYLQSCDTKKMKKVLVALVIIVLAVSVGMMQKQTPRATEVASSYDAASEALLERFREERRVEELQSQEHDTTVVTEPAHDVMQVEENKSAMLETHIEQLNSKISNLQLQVDLERKRAALAKEKEDTMFDALEASTHKVHTLSKQVVDSQSEIKGLQAQVTLSVEHSSMLESFNMLLLIIESILVFSAMVAYVKSHRIRSAFLKARNSYMIAWRRQQRVLAVAEEVYNDALRYKSEVEAADVGPRVSPDTSILNPWDPIMNDLEALIKTHVGVERQATPVQAMTALQQYFVSKKADEQQYLHVQETYVASQKRIETLEQKISELTKERDVSSTMTEETQQNLKAEIKALQNQVTLAEKQTSAVQEKVQSLSHEKHDLSEQLLKSNEELERVTAYATSLEHKIQEANDVRTHLDDFENTMNAAARKPGFTEDDEDDEMKENDIGHINESIVGERLRKIRQLIQDANDSPFELLSPSTNLYDGDDTEMALKKLPVVGPLHISSSDSDDDFTTLKQDESLDRMLKTSDMLSGQVGEYISILQGISYPSNESIVRDLQEKKTTVERLRSVLESHIAASEKELRACRALKAKRRQIDFLSEKEEQEHGDKELKAADALFYAREKEKDACIDLEKAQSVLRAAVSHARRVMRD